MCVCATLFSTVVFFVENDDQRERERGRRKISNPRNSRITCQISDMGFRLIKWFALSLLFFSSLPSFSLSACVLTFKFYHYYTGWPKKKWVEEEEECVQIEFICMPNRRSWDNGKGDKANAGFTLWYNRLLCSFVSFSGREQISHGGRDTKKQSQGFGPSR